MHIALIISSLSPGGSERVITTMANHWAERMEEVTIITLNSSAESSFYPLHERIKRIGLGEAVNSGNLIGAAGNNLRRVLSLRKTIRNVAPDAVISFLTETNILSVIATFGLSVPILISERSNPIVYPERQAWRILRSTIYPFASKVIAQTDGARGYYSNSVNRKCVVIPNPVGSCGNNDKRSGGSDSNSKSVITIARLDRNKGIDKLITAFARASQKRGEWKLIIYGDGPERENLVRLADELEVSQSVTFAGVTHDSHQALLRSDIFALSSKTEGFPNVLCEAMACGVAVVSFDCPYGPSEIITHGENGLLAAVEDVDALASSIGELMDDVSKRERLGNAAQFSIKKFSMEKVMEKWDSILRQSQVSVN